MAVVKLDVDDRNLCHDVDSCSTEVQVMDDAVLLLFLVQPIVKSHVLSSSSVHENVDVHARIDDEVMAHVVHCVHETGLDRIDNVPLDYGFQRVDILAEARDFLGIAYLRLGLD